MPVQIIKKNCLNCDHLGEDCDGGDPPWTHSWPICDKTYLVDAEEDKSEQPGFPLTDEQPCHLPAFWQYMAHDSELKEIFDREVASNDCRSFEKTYQRFTEKYR